MDRYGLRKSRAKHRSLPVINFMKTIEQKHRIKAPIAKVWQALVNPKIIEK
jgi:hypothetical protein